MVGITLIECGMTADDAILFIRGRRRGAINTKFVFSWMLVMCQASRFFEPLQTS